MVFSNVEKRRRHYDERSQRVENSFQDAHLLVHPGYSELNFNDNPEDSIFKWLNDTRGLHRTDYDSRQVYNSYKSGIQEVLMETESPVVLLYNQGSLDRYREFLGAEIDYPIDDVDLIIESDPDRGFIPESGIEQFADLLEEMDNDGRIYVHGEQNGICTDDSKESLDEVIRILDKDITVEEGEVFPSRPLSV